MPSILTELSSNPLCNYERGRVKVYDRTKSTENAIFCSESGCCQAIYLNFEKQRPNPEGGNPISELTYFGMQTNMFKDCYAEMSIDLRDFVNPLESKYSKLEYIEIYIRLLQKMGLLVEISAITATECKIVIDYSKFEADELAFLKLNWQTIRNLHLNFCAHVPARFIELADLFPTTDLFVLLQVAYRLIPYDTIVKSTAGYSFNNSNPIISKDVDTITAECLNLEINSSNLRAHLKGKRGLKGSFRKSADSYTQIESLEYTKIYNQLVQSESAQDLWSNIEKLLIKNQSKTTKKQEENVEF